MSIPTFLFFVSQVNNLLKMDFTFGLCALAAVAINSASAECYWIGYTGDEKEILRHSNSPDYNSLEKCKGRIK
jgi:hypothetical protein